MIPPFFCIRAMAETNMQVDLLTGIENSYLQAGNHFIGHKKVSENGERLLRLSDPGKSGAPREGQAQERLSIRS